jgi:hypothetical protein
MFSPQRAPSWEARIQPTTQAMDGEREMTNAQQHKIATIKDDAPA